MFLAELLIEIGITQPPNLNPLVGSSVGPPGACMTPSMETMAPTMIFRMCPLFRQRRSRNSEGRTDRTSTRGSARVSGLCGCFRKDGQQETAWIADLERATFPL